MKKLIVPMALAAMMFTACGQTEEKNENAQEQADKMADELINEMEEEETTGTDLAVEADSTAVMDSTDVMETEGEPAQEASK